MLEIHTEGDVTEKLIRKGFHLVNVTRWRDSKSGPIKDIFKLTKHIDVKCEAQKLFNKTAPCLNCQLFRHLSFKCTAPSRCVKCAGKNFCSYVDFIVPPDKRHKFKPIGRRAGVSVDHDTSEADGSYEQGFSCWPPPLCMILISIVEIICYIWNEVERDKEPKIPSENLGPVADYLVYDTFNRQEAWRFVTYMFVHIGWIHLVTNLIVQLFLGVPLELRNSWWRVSMVYIAGVVAGSLLTSISDPSVFLAGASGGVYALLTAHIANLIINWAEMSYPGVQLFVVLSLITADVITAVHNRYNEGDQTPIGYAAHIGGALAGFLVGIWVLKNVEPTSKEKYLWWTAFVIYILLMGTAIILNVFWTGHFATT